MIAALFVQSRGVYAGQVGVDLWPEERDARLYAGPWPVVAHPPCSTWGRLAELAWSKGGGRPGADGGCFEAALSAVKKFGGVLEHPAGSAAFLQHGIAVPERGGWHKGIDGLWTTEVDQGRYGHRAQKATWLVAHAIRPPLLDWTRADPGVRVEKMGRAERLRTPIPFRDLLLGIACTVPSIRAL